MKRLLSLIAFAIVTLSALADESEAFSIALTNGQTCLAAADRISKVYFSDDNQTMFVECDGAACAFATSDIRQMTYTALPTAVGIAYNGESVSIVNPYYFDGVEISAEGAYVTVRSTASQEVEYILSGQSDCGAFKIYSEKKYQITLKGLELTNPVGPAINSQTGKKGEIKSQKGFLNILADGHTYAEAPDGEDQKGCIFSEGQLIFKGAGELRVTGNRKHAICSDDYVSIENSTITLNTVADDCSAIQANDSILVSGGTLTINTIGDAAKGMKSKGLIRISGGEVTITQDGGLIIENGDPSYSTAVKTNADLFITGGTLAINNRADGGKGLSADGQIEIADGTLTITADGAPGTYDPTAIADEPQPEPGPDYKVYVSLPTSGTQYWTAVYLYNSAGQKIATLTDAVEVKPQSGTARTFYVYDFQQPTTGTFYFQSDPYKNQSPGGRPGGGTTTYTIKSSTFEGPTSGDAVFYTMQNSTTSGSTRTFTLTNATQTYAGGQISSASTGDKVYTAACITADGDVLISGGTLTLTAGGNQSKGIKSDQTVTLCGGDIEVTCSGNSAVVNRDPSYCTAVKATDFRGPGGSLKVTATGAASRGISAENSLTIDDGLYTILLSGAGATYTNQKNQSDSYAACGYKTDGYLAILGGTHTITSSGKGGKCIKVGGKATIGSLDSEGPEMTLGTTGQYISSSLGKPKAIKAQDELTMHSGRCTITTTQSGGEGLESKTQVTLNGGQLDIVAADDAISSNGPIIFNGVTASCVSTGNDAVDSNYGRSGAIQIKAGAVLAYTTKGSPEEGFDCDNNSYITVSGGTAISAGGSQGGGGGWGSSSSSGSIGSATQGYALVTTSISYSTGRYYTLQDAAGHNLATFTFRQAVNSTLALFTSPGMNSGNTYYVKYSTAEPTDATAKVGGLYMGSTASGTTQTASFTAK